MKQFHRYLLIGLLLELVLVFFVVVDRPTKRDDITVSSTRAPANQPRDCQRKQGVFSEKSSCEISSSGLASMRQVCVQTLTAQRALTKTQSSAAPFMSEVGTCQFRFGERFDESSGWSLLSYDKEFGVGVGPSFSVSEPNLPSTMLGRDCEKFGEITFSCKFQDDGKCVDVNLEEKNNFTGFQCMDGVQY